MNQLSTQNIFKALVCFVMMGVSQLGNAQCDLGANQTLCDGPVTLSTSGGLTAESCCTPTENATELVHYDLDACKNYDFAYDYSEFTPDINNSGCTSASASIVYRNNPSTNFHSCVDGVNGNGYGMCIKSNTGSTANFNDRTVRFDVTLTPDQTGHLTKLEFYELSPQQVTWNSNFYNSQYQGMNSRPLKYAMRVLKNGAVIYSSLDNNTTTSWTLESFDFSDDPDFAITSATTFNFELVAYDVVNPGTFHVWDIDNISVFGGCCSAGSGESSSFAWTYNAAPISTEESIVADAAGSYCLNYTDCEGNTCSDCVLVEECAPILAGLGNFTFQDFDDNGMYNPEFELPVTGIEVTLYNAADLDTPIGNKVTDDNGFYEFTELDPDLDYVVQFGTAIGFQRSSPNFPSSEGDEDKNDADFTTGFTDVIDLDPGEFDPTIDAGYVPFRGVMGAFVFLDGAAEQNNTGLAGAFTSDEEAAWKMRNTLQTDGILPTTDPYSTLTQFVHVNNDFGIEDADEDVMSNNSGAVDWVFVELRDPTDPSIVRATRSVLLQKDGRMVDTKGNHEIDFGTKIAPGDYYLAVRHRNHLGAMTANTLSIGTGEEHVVDFRDPAMETWGEHAQLFLDGNTRALWSGDSNVDGKIIYQGDNDDNTGAFFDVLSDPENVNGLINFTRMDYSPNDTKLDCTVQFQGPNDDLSKKFFHILTHPENTDGLLNFAIEQQLPQSDD